MVGSNNTHIVEKKFDSARANFKFFYKSKISFFGVKQHYYNVTSMFIVHCTYRFSTRECSFSPTFYLNVNTLDRGRERERERVII